MTGLEPATTGITSASTGLVWSIWACESRFYSASSPTCAVGYAAVRWCLPHARPTSCPTWGNLPGCRAALRSVLSCAGEGSRSRRRCRVPGPPGPRPVSSAICLPTRHVRTCRPLTGRAERLHVVRSQMESSPSHRRASPWELRLPLPTPVAGVGDQFQRNSPVACRFGGVDPGDFRAPEFGRAQRPPGDRAAFWYFEPARCRGTSTSTRPPSTHCRRRTPLPVSSPERDDKSDGSIGTTGPAPTRRLAGRRSCVAGRSAIGAKTSSTDTPR